MAKITAAGAINPDIGIFMMVRQAKISEAKLSRFRLQVQQLRSGEFSPATGPLQARDATHRAGGREEPIRKNQIRGLGDAIAVVARFTGLDRVAKLWERKTGKPCGCGKRQEKLNHLVPFRSRVLK